MFCKIYTPLAYAMFIYIIGSIYYFKNGHQIGMIYWNFEIIIQYHFLYILLLSLSKYIHILYTFIQLTLNYQIISKTKALTKKLYL